MKRISLLTFLMTCCTMVIFAQGILLSNSVGVSVANGDTIVVNGNTNDFMLQTTLGVFNNTANSKDVLVERTLLYMLPTTSAYFAFGVYMYPPSVSISPDPATIPAGVLDVSFMGGYETMNLPGTSYVRYNFFDQANPADSAWVIIAYQVSSAMGSGEVQSGRNPSIFPNPGHGVFHIQWPDNRPSGNVTMELIHPTGIRKKWSQPVGTILNLAGEPPGLYLLRMTESSGTTTTWMRLIIQ